MVVRLTSVLQAFRAGSFASLKAVVRLQTLFLLIFLATMSLWSGHSFAVPAGTIIKNAATLDYNVTTAYYNLTSNTDEFFVESRFPPNTSEMTVSGLETTNFYPGTGGSLNIYIDNIGNNDLNDGVLIIDTPVNTELIMTDDVATLIQETSTDSITTRQYAIDDIAMSHKLSFQAQLTLAVDASPENNKLTVRHTANNQTINQQAISLNISPRSDANLLILTQSPDDEEASLLSIEQPSYKDSNGQYVTFPIPSLAGVTTIQKTKTHAKNNSGSPATLITDAPIPLKPTNKFHHDQIVYISVEDADQNTDQIKPEHIEVPLSITADGESETIRLTENSENSGVFSGYIQLKRAPTVSNNGILEVHPNTRVDINYSDPFESNSATIEQIVLVDPFGVIVDSATGEYLNGYSVHMIDADTGLHTTVYGDDGVSIHPNPITTGATATDSSGAVYEFSDGAYRFPLAAVGNYKIVVVPPADAQYRWPSTQPSDLINQLANGPFAITLGSRGETFSLLQEIPLHIDIPVDPLDTHLYIQRSANKDKVSPGDFVQYKVRLENVANAAIEDVILSDSLPHGFRFMADSLLINNAASTAAQISEDGKQITFNLGDMESGATHTIDYVIAVGAVNKRATSTSSHAIANGGGATSNTAEHEVQILDELMRSRALLMGQVVLNPSDDNAQGGPHHGLAGVRIYMEDGRYAVTDKRGMYHFEDVRPGSHIIQLDIDTLPEGYETILKEENSRFANNSWSQFVDIQGGTLWRSDFHVAVKAVPEGNVSIRISNLPQITSGDLIYKIDISNENIDVENIRVIVMLSEGAVYKSGTSFLNGKKIIDPVINDNMLTYRLRNISGINWKETLRFSVSPTTSSPARELVTKAFMLIDTPARPNKRTPVAEHNLMSTVSDIKDNGFNQAKEGALQTLIIQGEDPAEKISISKKPATNRDQKKHHEMNYDAQWFKDKNATIQWLLPQSEFLPKQTSTPIVVKHGHDQAVEVFLNGMPVQWANYEGSIKNTHGAKLSHWKGVDLKIGHNHLEVVIKDQSGAEVQRLTRSVYVSGAFAKAELITDKSNLVADGRSNPVIALRVTDKSGYPMREGMSGQFRIKAPYRVADNSDFNLEIMPGSVSQNLHTFTVDTNGVALITLKPTNRSGEVEIELNGQSQEKQIIKAKLKTEKRDWILVGLAEGTAGYNEIEGNVEPLDAKSNQEHLYQDGRIAFFAKGQILGKWLLTMAYDSDKQHIPGEDPNINQSIDPDSYYSIYGDSSNSGNDAQSSEKLYLMIERDDFYLLFGDYATDFNQTELASYSRTLTGIKTRYEGESLDVAIFTSQTNQSYVKEEFRGESRSGPYRLSHSNIAMNTEKVIIETRDRFRSEEILQSIQLTRHSDYDIDYKEGTIVFRRPVFSIDQNMDHLFVVIQYEAFDDANERTTYGGRAKIKLTDKFSIGVTHVNEGRTGGEAKLGGIDSDYQINDNTKLHLEAARTIDNNIIGANGQGDAFVAELEHQTDISNSKAYVRETDTGFGLGQINASEDSSRKIGAETSIAVNDHVNITAQAYRQEQTATKATRDLVETEASLTLDSSSLRLGGRAAVDQHDDASQQKSQQISAGISQGFFEDMVVARLDHEENINNDENSIDFPDLTRMGVDIRLNKKATLFAEQEISNGQTRDTRSTLLGIKSSPWEGGTLYTGLTETQSTEEESTSANIAGTQTWQLSEAWSLDIGAEQSKLLSESTGTQLNNNVPFAHGAVDDFTATSVGLTYMKGDWMWTTRIENRNGTAEDNHSLSTSIQTTPSASLSILSSLTITERSQITGAEQTSTDVSLGLAYHPSDSRWILLDKLELKKDETTGSEFNGEGKRLINMFNANFKTGTWQLSLQYAAKVIDERIKQQNYNSFTDLAGFESRYDLTKNWDIGLHGSVLRAQKLNHYDYSSGISIGHSVAKNIWVSLGYNFTGFRDEDFSTANQTSEGVFIRFRMKFDQYSVKDAINWMNH